MMDIYFEPNYGKLYEKSEGGICEHFEYRNSHGSILHTFIKREIPIRVNMNVYYDIVTPYGYGGPIIKTCEEGFKKELVESFKKQFELYCKENNIISEFIRFHPIVENALDFSIVYDTENIRKTVGTNIKQYEDPIQSEFSKSTRKTIRKILNSGVEYRVTRSPNDLGDFKQIYYSTMERNDANDYYYFDDTYFDTCLSSFKDNIILIEVLYKGNVIAAGFYFVYGNVIHAHLSGTYKDYLHLSPAYIIKYATVRWAKKNGIDLIHYGGGTSNSENDSLYKFKKKFGKNTDFDFYVGRKIWNPAIYKELCIKQNVDDNINFFPAYRYETN